jgi:hypothetical protein
MSGLLPQWVRVCVSLAPAWLPLANAQSPALPPEWEVRNNLTALVEQVRRLKPILQGVKTEEWSQKGAPETYQAQWKSITSELDYLVRSTEELSREPERLTVALKVFLRMQAMESLLVSFQDGIRKYQNPALADLLRGVMTENAVHREKLREYLVQLAAVKEQECKIMNEEAQRCRALISQQPPAAKRQGKQTEPK